MTPSASRQRPVTQRLRSTMVERLQAKVAGGRPIIGAGCATTSAAQAAAADVDFIVVQSSGGDEVAGGRSLAGLLPEGNANHSVKAISSEILGAVNGTPALAGVCGTDPFLLTRRFLRELKDLGFIGVQNFPTVGLIDGTFRANLESTGMSYRMEVDCIAAARELDLFTVAYAFNPEEATWMIEAGADVVVAHPGLTANDGFGSTKITLEDFVKRMDEMAEACRGARAECLVLCHSDSIAEPHEAQHVLDHCQVDGFFGAAQHVKHWTTLALPPRRQSLTPENGGRS